ncbi:hypothetical protein P5673_013797 [Acropora cervicornis]|uniref:Uncharacterized protein n=1 Tax=Acropora cervicornis TaxID=6130 RepID=A0AAD9QKH3_ACRCE|nr:hypothetical protein P5673_013797 [Acropora cervicornis]
MVHHSPVLHRDEMKMPEEATASNVAVLNRVEFIQQLASQDMDKILLRLLSRPMRRKR